MKKFEQKFDTLIAADTVLTGDLDFDGAIVIAGTVIGNLAPRGKTTTSIVIEPTGSVKGDMKADFIVIKGQAKSSQIECSELLTVASSATVNAMIYYNKISIADGSVIEGTLNRYLNTAEILDVE